jgi:hypothetical protein
VWPGVRGVGAERWDGAPDQLATLDVPGRQTGEEFDTVRCAFSEGAPIFDGSRIHQQSHIQLAVRNTACIVGVFRPTG